MDIPSSTVTAVSPASPPPGRPASPVPQRRAGAPLLTGGGTGRDPCRARRATPLAPNPLGPCRLGRVKLVAAAHRDRVGDARQAKAVAAETLRLLSGVACLDGPPVTAESLALTGRDSAANERQLRSVCAQWLEKLDAGEYDNVVFILAGSDLELAPVLGDLTAHRRLITVFTGHRITQDIKDAGTLPTIVALPGSIDIAPDERAALERKTCLVSVAGVAHDLTERMIADTARQYQDSRHKPLPPIDRDTVSILLGGDVTDDAGRLRHRYTEDDAREQAVRIAELELKGRERCRFVVVSSPRTGRFGASGQEHAPNPHRAGLRDTVTQAFENALRAYPNVEVLVYDFQYGETPSAYIPLVQAHRQAAGNAGRIHVPGDSVSMVSEVASVLPAAMIVDETASMDESHYRELAALTKETGIATLDMDGRLRPGKGDAATSPAPAAPRIAQAIVARLRASRRPAADDTPPPEDPDQRVPGSP